MNERITKHWNKFHKTAQKDNHNTTAAWERLHVNLPEWVSLPKETLMEINLREKGKVSGVWGVSLTGYFSSGSMSRASPKMVLQYSAILACCLALWISRYTSLRCFEWKKNISAGGQTAQTESKVTYESTWFSKDRIRGYGEVLKALSAIASITSCSPAKNKKNFVDKNLSTFTQVPKQFEVSAHTSMSFYFGIS